MHCLYCDRPLALLKRLTGDAEFCSKEHRKIYQQEHNQLALARLLESQPKDKQKPRPDKPEPDKPQSEKPQSEKPQPEKPQPEKPQPQKQQRPEPAPEVILPVKEPESPQPALAAFMPGNVEPGRLPSAPRTDSVAHFKRNSPVWGGTETKDSPKPQPNTAAFLDYSAHPRSIAAPARFQGKPAFAPSPISMGRAGVVVRSPQPAGPGFLSEQFPARPSLGKLRPSPPARFGPRPTVTSSPAAVLHVCANSTLRMARFLSGYTVPRTVATTLRAPALETRWKPISPALPAQLSGKIVLVLGRMLQRPVRPASQDRVPEIFEIPSRPVTFPQYSPRMGRLEDRLHRTDRIGFSPP
jgi:hypothetical protein